MFKFIFSALLLISFQPSFARLIVISDLDETIKQTTRAESNAWGTLRRVLFSTQVYRGMPQLLQSMERYTDRQIVLTGSPTVVNANIWRLFRTHQIPINGLITNRKAPLVKTESYKRARLKELFKRYHDARFILIGDDTSKDAKVYKEIAAANPGRVLAIYIHQVQNERPQKGVTNFISSYEVAYHEYLAGRMDLQDVLSIHTYLFESDKLRGLFPRSVYCPKNPLPWGELTNPDLFPYTVEMMQKVTDFCNNEYITPTIIPLDMELAIL